MAVVLYVRPSLMFDGGAWKEFGLTSTNNNTTIFPFWMFVVLWSIASYVAGTLCVLGFSTLSAQTPEGAEVVAEAPVANAPVANAPVANVEAEAEAETETETEAETKTKTEAETAPELEFNDISQATRQMKKAMEPKRKAPRRIVSSNRPEITEPKAAKAPLSGYYVKGKRRGKPTYIYYGKDPPFE